MESQRENSEINIEVRLTEETRRLQENLRDYAQNIFQMKQILDEEIWTKPN